MFSGVFYPPLGDYKEMNGRLQFMESVAEILFNYLRNLIYYPEKAALDIDKLPEAFHELGSGLQYLAKCVVETTTLAQALAKGDLNMKSPSRGNEIAAPLKSLQASLKHLTWQSQQVAKGDYKQRVAFMGEFSDAFNAMVEQLAERQLKQENEIHLIKKKTDSLEQSNLLLSALMHHVPQQIIVIDRDTREILLMNDIAINEVNNNANYVEKLLQIMSDHDDFNRGEIDINFKLGELDRDFVIKTYLLEWNNSNAEVFVISDVSVTKSKIKELEIQAYHDSATQLYNRTFGMLTLDNWLYEKKQFVLIFADLDNLKYINDEFGHNEGDIYIGIAAKYLKSFSPDAVVCRVGGDEFMLLAPSISYDEAFASMNKIYQSFENDEYLKDKSYAYSISFGIVAVGINNKLPASDILSIADERMYEHKRMRKKNRQM